MTATVESKPWDFSHVLDLVNTLTAQGDLPPSRSHTEADNTYAVKKDDQSSRYNNQVYAMTPSRLGDFSKLWQYLGTPVDAAVPELTTQEPQSLAKNDFEVFAKAGYASDSAAHHQSSSRVRPVTPPLRKSKSTKKAKRSKHQNQSSEEEIAADTVSDGSIGPDTPTLTKTQRKKRNRRERKAKEVAAAAGQEAKVGEAHVSESEADVVRPASSLKPTSAPNGAPNGGPSTPKSNHHDCTQHRAGDASGKSLSDSLLEAAKVAAQKVDEAKRANRETLASHSDVAPATAPTANTRNALNRQHSHPPPPTQLRKASAPRYVDIRTNQQYPLSASKGGNAARLVPSTVQPPTQSPAQSVPKRHQHNSSQNTVVNHNPNKIEPMIPRSGEDRHWALLLKLIRDFNEDRKHLFNPMNLTTHNNDPKGIHVFVDASNIFIGFNEQLKRSRNIPPWTHIPPVDLSFDALALLMERRRSVAKRVLVGSTPNLPAFDKAKAVGYECNILDKVYKARELTERQIFFKEHDRYGFPKRAKAPPANNVATPNGVPGDGNGSGSETNAPQYAPARMIEQGVDEILHLKILESVVDTDAPGTIVLATGDAARAEYSEGFMAMAERALKKGWTVELVSWSSNISATYRRKGWVDAWGERFRIVLLDDYAEELLDV